MTLKVHVGDDCPLTAIDADVENVDLQQMNGECRATFVSRDDEDLNVLQTYQEMEPGLRLTGVSPTRVYPAHRRY